MGLESLNKNDSHTKAFHIANKRTSYLKPGYRHNITPNYTLAYLLMALVCIWQFYTSEIKNIWKTLD